MEWQTQKSEKNKKTNLFPRVLLMKNCKDYFVICHLFQILFCGISISARKTCDIRFGKWFINKRKIESNQIEASFNNLKKKKQNFKYFQKSN